MAELGESVIGADNAGLRNRDGSFCGHFEKTSTEGTVPIAFFSNLPT